MSGSKNEVLKTKGDFQLVKVSEEKYEILENGKLIISIEGKDSKELLEEQFNNVGKGYVII